MYSSPHLLSHAFTHHLLSINHLPSAIIYIEFYELKNKIYVMEVPGKLPYYLKNTNKIYSPTCEVIDI